MVWLPLAVLVAACGAQAADGTATTGLADRPHSARPIAAIRYGASPTELVVTVVGPDQSVRECDEERVGEVLPIADVSVRLAILVPLPEPPDSCPDRSEDVVVALDEPLDGRSIETYGTGRWVDEAGVLLLDPMSRPCGRSDCSAPGPTPASCDPSVYHDSVIGQIDGADPENSNERCDGSFLTFDLTVGAGGCPPDDRELCADAQRGFFVADLAGQWALVTYGKDLTCDDVYETSLIQFPPAVC